METRLAAPFRDQALGQEADRVLRSCVHCGFCLATCPTYQLLGSELDSPRGRIYLIKQVLEGQDAGARTQLHLDRCLTCRSCETTCPSGVRYGRLLDIGRAVLEARVPRTPWARLRRWALNFVLPHRRRFALALALGRAVRPLLPARLARAVPAAVSGPAWPAYGEAPRAGERTMLVLEGCVQAELAPSINASLARVLERLGVRLLPAPGAGCCGAIGFHLNRVEEAQALARRNIDAWWPRIEGGAEAIVVSASGCGMQVRDYGHLLRDDPDYAERAARVAALVKDPVEILEGEDLAALAGPERPGPIAFHPPCTLQHGLRLAGRVEAVLAGTGFTLTEIEDRHLCCGSAGTYSILQPALAEQLGARKITALERGDPACIATANIGCQAHLQARAGRRVVHWVELLDPENPVHKALRRR